MKRRIGSAVVALGMLLPAVAHAQAYSCTPPTTAPQPHAELPSPDEPRRVVPIGGYTLAITWSPEYCHGRHTGDDASFQCGRANRFGFTLHGLWPDGVGAKWPQYCRSTALLPAPLIARNMCATPSAQLLQHEWAKHGTCTGESPMRYFAQSTGLFAQLRFPNMTRLARGRVTAGQLASAIARENPGMTPAMMRVTANRQGWLDEVWFCLDTELRYVACGARKGGVSATRMLRIARLRR